MKSGRFLSYSTCVFNRFVGLQFATSFTSFPGGNQVDGLQPASSWPSLYNYIRHGPKDKLHVAKLLQSVADKSSRGDVSPGWFRQKPND